MTRTSSAIVGAPAARAAPDRRRLCATPEEAVGHLGAVQAQDYGPAKWSVGARVAGATDARRGARPSPPARILRTHVLRPTWHFVLPADIRWLLTATAPRVKARDARRYAQLGLDEDTLRRSATALVAALRGGNQLTRAEAAAVLTAAGIGVDGQRLPYLLMDAELDALICSGPRRGKQHTYVLLEERAPDARDLPRDEALAELARRYFSEPRTGDRQGLRRVGDADARRGARRDRGGGAGAAGARTWTVCALVGAATGRGAAERAPAPRSTVRPPRPGLRRDTSWATARPSSLLARPGSPWAPATPPVFRLVVLLDGGVAGFWRRRPKRRSGDRRGRPAGAVRRRRRRRRSRPRPRATARSWVCPRRSGSRSRRAERGDPAPPAGRPPLSTALSSG